MRSRRTEGTICLDGTWGLIYRIGEIAYTEFEDGTFRYEFVPNWAVIDLLGPPEFQGVPGFDLDTRKNVYTRENITPAFIAERAPAENREGLWQMLQDAGMDYLDKVEWLIRTDTRYIGDGLYVLATDAVGNVEDVPVELADAVASAQNSLHAQIAVLRRLCVGAPVRLDGEEIGTDARKVLHAVLRALAEKAYAYREARRKEGVRQAAERGVRAGRKRKAVDSLVLAETLDMYDRGAIDAKAAAARLGVSKATFFRRLKEHREGSD